jgi:fatty-acyl-CoA synthase
MPDVQLNTESGRIELKRSSAPRRDESAGMNASSRSAPLISTLREIEAIERIPLSERGLPSSTYEMLRSGAAQYPDAPALSFFARAADHASPFVWTHAELFHDITRAANLFRRLGIGRADVVAFVLPNLPETHFVIWGGEAAGIVFAINPLLEAESIAELLRAGGAKWLVTLGPTPGLDLWERASRAAAAAPALRGLLTVELTSYSASTTNFAGRSSPASREGLAVLSLREAMSGEKDGALNFEPPGTEDISSYFCTGGTTGLPKIATRTHRSEVFDSWAMQIATWGLDAPARTYLCGLPLFHVNGQLVTGLAVWSRGGHVVLATPQGYRDKTVIENFWAIVERYRVNAFSGVPTVYAALLQVPIGGRDLSSLEFGACGAAPMPVELFRDFEAKTHIHIVEAYGLTEGACVSSVNPRRGEPRIGSVGLRLPYQDMAVMVLNEAGECVRLANIDEPGVLAIRGPNVFAGYVNPAHEATLWITHDGEGWLNTGDLARQDADGYFWLTGRKKELIIRGGHNIDPKVIEEPMSAHPAVALAAAIGRPDARSGEVPVLYVQLKAGSEISEQELLDYAIAHIPERAARPNFVKALPALPLTAVGKIFKPALVRREIVDVVRASAATSGTELAALEVVQDPNRGWLARMSVLDDGAALSSSLGAFAFASEITPTTRSN